MVDTLIGREWHLATLGSALDELLAGTGAALALAGEPGMGKSALLWAAANKARAAGVAVVAARGADLIQSPGLRAACMHVVDAVRGHAAAGRPALVTVDDLHLLGEDEAGLVARLLRFTANDPVLCVLAYRRRQLAPGTAAMLADASAGLLQLASLDPLTRDQAAGLLGERPDADEIHRQAAGNPQYIKVLCALRDTGATAEAGASIFGELAGLDSDALAVMRAAAVIAEPFSVALLAEVADLDEAAAARALDQLTAVDLIRPAERGPCLALRHRVVGDAVYERLEPSLRSALHRRAANALAEGAAPVDHRARHITRAPDPQNPEHLTTLIAAARGAIYSSPATAAEYLQAALPLLTAGQQGNDHAHEAQVLLARARLLSGEFSDGRALLDALRAAGPDRPDGAALDSSRLERRLGRYVEAGALARSGLAALAETDSATAAALHAEVADTAYDMQDYETSRAHAETAAAIAARHGDPVGEAHALAQSALGHLFTGDEATAVNRATRAAELIDAASDSTLLTNLAASLQLGMTEGLLGRLSDSERHLARAEILGRRTGQTYLDASLLTVLANSQCRLGKLNQALVTLDRVARTHDQLNEHGGRNVAEEAVAANLRGATLYWRDAPGDAEQVRAEAHRSLVLASDSTTSWALAVRCFQAELVLFLDEPARSRSLLLEAAGKDLSWISPWRRPRWCDTLAEAALAVGDAADAAYWAAAAAKAPQDPSTLRAFALRAGMWAYAAAGDYDAALTRAQDVVREFTTRGERIEVCRTLLAVAEFALNAGQMHQVAGRLDRVALVAEQCGSARLLKEVARLRLRLDAMTDAQPDPQSTSALLSVREREIADLVSTGMTNTAIAERLFLSVRTVESHLRQVYRKLDVPNRAALTRALLDDGRT